MFRKPLLQLLVVCAVIGFWPAPSQSQQPPTSFDGDSTGPEHAPLPPEYTDPAFDRYVDLRQVGAAAAASSATEMVDAALLLAEGERILLRTHRSGLTVEQLLRTALKWSVLQQDQATLDRLAKVAKSTRNPELQQQIEAAKKLAGAAREANSSLTIALDSTDAETLRDLKRWIDQTRSASALGDEQSLLNLQFAVDEIEGRLNDATRAAVLAEIDAALKSVQQPGAKNEVLIRLAGAARGYETNKFDLKAEVENGGWTVAWADDVSETDAINGVVAAGVSIYTGNPAAFYAWVDALISDTIRSLMKSATKQFPQAVAKQAQQLAAEVIKQALRGKSPQEVFRQYDTVDFKAGAIRYSGRNYNGSYNIFTGEHEEITLSKTWGMKPYVAFRWRGSAGTPNNNSGANTSSTPKTRVYTITNDTRTSVTIEFSPSGNTARLGPGQTTTARSAILNGDNPKLTARASSGKYWTRTISIQNGVYRIINRADGGIQIVP